MPYDANPSQDVVNELIKLGATSFVPKPMNRTILMKVIKDILSQNTISLTRKKSKNSRMEKIVVLNTNHD